MHHSTRGLSAAGTLAALIFCSLFLSSCATTKGTDSGTSSKSVTSEGVAEYDGEARTFLGMPIKEDTAPAENHSWIVDSPPSAATDPKNWLDYGCYYLGEIALAPLRFIQLVIDGA